MNIIGPDALVFGVDDLDAAARYMTDFGLQAAGKVLHGQLFAAMDGTGVIICGSDDPSLPPPLSPNNQLRKVIYGVADRASLAQIAAELGKDREVRSLADGSLEAVDDAGITLGFQLTARRDIDMPVEKINAPGAPLQRPVNCVGVATSSPIPKSRSPPVASSATSWRPWTTSSTWWTSRFSRSTSR